MGPAWSNASGTRAAHKVQPWLLLVGAAAGVEAWLIVRRVPGYSTVGDSNAALAVDLGAGWILLAAALSLLRLDVRGSRSLGLSAIATAWFIAEWNSPGAPSGVVFTIGLVLGTICPVVVAHVVLGWPERGHRSATVLALVVGYVSTVGLAGVVPAMFFDPSTAGCNGCPADLLLVRDAPRLVAASVTGSIWAGAVWVPALGVILLVRLVRWSPARRRAAAPTAASAVLYLGVVGMEYWLSVARGYLGSDPTDRQLRVAEAMLLIAIAVGTWWPLLDRRLTRARVARLVVVAGELAEPEGLDRALGAVVGDRSLQVLYPVGGRWVDAVGRPSDVAGDRVTTPVTRDGAPMALLVHSPGGLDRDGLAEDVANTAGLVLENARLHAERRARLADLQASRARVVHGADEARRRLERDLHDGAQQHLVAVSLAIRLAQIRGTAVMDAAAAARLQQAQVEIATALAELRAVARGLYPRELADEGLTAALEVYAETAAIPVRIRSVPGPRFPAAVESAAYFVVAHRLGRAGVDRASVFVERHGDTAVVSIEDDGPAGDLEAIRDRVAALAGSVSAESAPGAGTRTRVELPCGS